MKKLEIEKQELLEGGCTCEGAGICCEHWDLTWWDPGMDFAVCYSCDGTLQYIEQW